MSIAPDSVSLPGGQPAPPPWVIYPRVLLAVQGLIWAFVVAVGLVALVTNARAIISGHGAPPHGVGAFAVDAAFLTLGAALAAGSMVLSEGLERRRRSARRAAIALECFMISFGLYLAQSSIAGFLAGGAGAVLSCAAVSCLATKPARRWFRDSSQSEV